MADLATDDKVDTTDTTDTTDKVDTTTDVKVDAVDKADVVAKADDDWRSDLAGDDPDLLKFAGRYHSKPAFLKAVKDINDGIKSGKYVKPLGDDPTEADLAAHRKSIGVPEKAADYNEKLSEGLVLGADDKPIFDEFFEAMHGANAPAPVVAAAADWYMKLVEKQDADIAARVAEATQKCEDELRQEWGGDYRRNLNATDGFIGTLPAEVQAAVNEGFGPDGVPLQSNPAVKKWLAGLALEANPLATVVPGSGANQASAVADEIAAIEKRMETDRTAYFKDEKAQARYLELIEARDKMAEKG